MIREIKDKAAIAAALELIWVTFLQFEAPDYSDEGIQAFRSFIDDEDIIASLEFWGDYAGDELRGTIAANEDRRHICCFFVKARYHRQGIGRALWEHLLNSSDHQVYTVHASPYAVPVYHKLGFVEMSEEQTSDGMRFTPMRFERKKDHGIQDR